jgi:hypothetical protein
MNQELIAIERRSGVTLYGRIIDQKTKKLGQYEVHSDMLGFDGNVYAKYKEAETRMAAMIGVKSSS